MHDTSPTTIPASKGIDDLLREQTIGVAGGRPLANLPSSGGSGPAVIGINGQIGEPGGFGGIGDGGLGGIAGALPGLIPGMAGNGCWGGGGASLGDTLMGVAGNAIGSMVGDAVNKLLAVDDGDSVAVGAAKHLAQRALPLAQEALSDPAAFAARLSALFEGTKSSASIPIGLAQPSGAGAGVALFNGLPPTRLGDRALMPAEKDIGEFVEGNATITSNGAPVAGAVHHALGKKGTWAIPQQLSPDVFMGAAPMAISAGHPQAQQKPAPAGGAGSAGGTGGAEGTPGGQAPAGAEGGPTSRSGTDASPQAGSSTGASAPGGTSDPTATPSPAPAPKPTESSGEAPATSDDPTATPTPSPAPAPTPTSSAGESTDPPPEGYSTTTPVSPIPQPTPIEEQRALEEQRRRAERDQRVHENRNQWQAGLCPDEPPPDGWRDDATGITYEADNNITEWWYHEGEDCYRGTGGDSLENMHTKYGEDERGYVRDNGYDPATLEPGVHCCYDGKQPGQTSSYDFSSDFASHWTLDVSPHDRSNPEYRQYPTSGRSPNSPVEASSARGSSASSSSQGSIGQAVDVGRTLVDGLSGQSSGSAPSMFAPGKPDGGAAAGSSGRDDSAVMLVSLLSAPSAAKAPWDSIAVSSGGAGAGGSGGASGGGAGGESDSTSDVASEDTAKAKKPGGREPVDEKTSETIKINADEVMAKYKNDEVKYKLGADARDGSKQADCSHYVHDVMEQSDVNVPYETTANIGSSSAYKEVGATDARPGDVIVQGNHMGIYMGKDKDGRPIGNQMGVNSGPSAQTFGSGGSLGKKEPVKYYRPNPYPKKPSSPAPAKK